MHVCRCGCSRAHVCTQSYASIRIHIASLPSFLLRLRVRLLLLALLTHAHCHHLSSPESIRSLTHTLECQRLLSLICSFTLTVRCRPHRFSSLLVRPSFPPHPPCFSFLLSLLVLPFPSFPVSPAFSPFLSDSQ